MATEIEHKYLVNKKLWEEIVPFKSVEVQQVYLSTDPDKTIRVRIKDDNGFMTIKGKAIGASRKEFEFEIPIEDANELVGIYSSHKIEKTRHYVLHDGNTWEVDEFKGLNNGLMVAELELKSDDEKYSIPDWIDKEVTNDYKYTNASLCVNPFSKW